MSSISAQAFLVPIESSNSNTTSSLQVYQHTSIASSTLIYNYGGEDSNGFWTNRLSVLNLAAGSGFKKQTKLKSLEWEKPKYNSFPPKKDGHVMMLTCGSAGNAQKKIFLFGGNDNQNISGNNNALYSIDLENLTWKIEMKHQDDHSRPFGRSHSAFTQIKNYLYMFGGKITSLQSSSNGSDPTSVSVKTLDDFWMFNCENLTWKKLSNKLLSTNESLPKLTGATLCASSKGTDLFLYGGVCDKEYSNELYKYSVKNDSWECITSKMKGDIPQFGRERHACCLLSKSNEMLISGGWIFGGVSSQILSLNLDTLVWKNVNVSMGSNSMESKMLQRYGHTMVALEGAVNEQIPLVVMIGGKDLTMSNRGEVILIALHSKDATWTTLAQSFGQKQDHSLNEEWTRYEKVSGLLPATPMTDDYLSSMLGVTSTVSSSPSMVATTSTTTSTTSTATSTPPAVPKRPSFSKASTGDSTKQENVSESTISSTTPPSIPKRPVRKEEDTPPKKSTSSSTVEEETKKPSTSAIITTTSTESKPTTSGSKTVKVDSTMSPSADAISEKLQEAEQRPKLELAKKGARMQQRKPKTVNADLSKLDKVTKEATLDVPDDSKFKKLEIESKKVVTPTNEEQPSGESSSQDKKPKFGVGIGGNPMMSELASKLKKK
ncbi:hypothetical protein FDP41_012204 [Naegleria fowleri]|uniref:Uncharacterized protein n=1 Tax=Naegleria fowleri TaxID=5763 RepID=A0A6A5C144_NAEFO|nr:uncharacterized protein FDP41_012506 [Naegleria fowleri]XP_044566260.1 uncharacterized protein FDP41_012204 [Naegleria fowleri]KAF0981396.1 hypothetical protein FDP41_012506 [Naegleria fowleri]KAF0981547.1 hypothetical protein FDP41_012204 [Naegleria fowleri]CAG4719387.1 unnamed protein product [Naegleria fowleri]